MGGGPSTPALAAAVSNAGALGSLAGGYLAPEAILEEVRQTRALTERPFAINLFAELHPTPPGEAQIHAWLEFLKPYHAQLGLPEPVMPATVAEPFAAQFEAVLEAQPAVFSFTFGIPEAHYLDALRESGILIVGTVTTVEEGKALEAAGVDGVVSQGSEAGAHRGTFLHDFDEAMIPTLDLVKALASTISTPIIASGGIMDGGHIDLALSCSAELVQLGTAFLTCDEAGTSAPYRQALQDATDDTTTIITAYSGRAARGLPNRFVEEAQQLPPLPYPYQNALTRPLRAAAAKQDRAEFLSLWAGQGVTRTRSMPAATLIETLTSEMQESQM
jgi:nitronate monooxygenase